MRAVRSCRDQPRSAAAHKLRAEPEPGTSNPEPNLNKNREPRSKKCERRSSPTCHPGPAKPAVPVRILREVLLVVVLCVVERRRGGNLRGDRPVPRVGKPRLERGARGFGRTRLSGRLAVDGGPILSPDVVALPHALRGI